MAIRVLYVLDRFHGPGAGAEGQLLLLLRLLDRTRFEPLLVTLRGDEQLSQHVPGIPVRRLDVRSLASWGGLRQLLSLVWWAKRRGVAVAHLFFNDATLSLPPLLRLAGIRVVASRLDLGFWYRPRQMPWLRLMSSFLDGVIANCNAVKEVVAREERVPPGKITVIYNGIGRAVQDVDVAAWRRRIGVPDDARVAVIVANLRPLKRVDDAIRALARVRPVVPNAHLVLVGEDRSSSAGLSHRQELGALAADLGVADAVHFLGALADPLPVVQAADVGVLCSETEGLSNAVMEYMQVGKPVVCTRVGGNPDLVTHGFNGYLVEVGDVAGLAGGLQKLLQDPALARRMGSHGPLLCREMFDQHLMARRHEGLYARIARVSRDGGHADGL